MPANKPEFTCNNRKPSVIAGADVPVVTRCMRAGEESSLTESPTSPKPPFIPAASAEIASKIMPTSANNSADNQNRPTSKINLSTGSDRPEQANSLNRQILALAIPSLGALVVEPLLVFADSAMVGHLGTMQLAGLTIASTILMMIVGMCIFLAYTTTAITARRLGAGDQGGAVRGGIAGMWFAAGLGTILALASFVLAPTLVDLFHPSIDVGVFAVIYLRWSAPGLVGMLVVLAATGTLRGLLDTRTPFVVTTLGSLANIALNALFMYGFRLGIVGSALGTALTQSAMAVALIVVVATGARRLQVPLRPDFAGIRSVASSGAPLVIRTATLQIAILSTMAVATQLGTAQLAGHQIVKTTWTFCAYALDALAIAAQALVGHSLGQGDSVWVRSLLRRCLAWGAWAGLAIGGLLMLVSPWLARLFSPDPQVIAAATPALLVAGAFQLLAGIVFIYDGVLIGANDGKYLAVAGAITLVFYLPALVAVYYFAPPSPVGLAWLWAAYGAVLFGARGITLWLRARTDSWMKLVAPHVG